MNAYVVIFLSLITGCTTCIPAHACTEDEAVAQAASVLPESWIHHSTVLADHEYLDIPF